MDKFAKESAKIRQLASLSPESLMDHIAKGNRTLTDVAPNLSGPMQATAMKGMQYLHSKLPGPATEFMGSDEYEPSKSQKSDWLKQHEAVNDPIGALEHVKNGTLTQAHMEALNAVHPELLQNMREQVAENMDTKSMKNLPYSTKIALSKFLGQPQDQSLVPGVVTADQATFAQQAPGQSAGSPAPKSSKSGLDKLTLSKRSETETQATDSDLD